MIDRYAPDLSKPISFDFMCKYLHGAWRSVFCSDSCKWPLIPGLKTGGFPAFITKSRAIKFPSFYNQLVNARTKSNHFVAFALNQHSVGKQIHRVRNFRNRHYVNNLIAAAITPVCKHCDCGSSFGDLSSTLLYHPANRECNRSPV